VISSAPAEQSGDGALDSKSRHNQAIKSGVALRLPPHSKYRPSFSMIHFKRACFLAIGLSQLLVASCKPKPTRNRLDENRFPRIVLWAWERPEDLQTVDAQRFAVAFLAQTLVLKGEDVIFSPRHQPLDVQPQTKLMAVTRIESQKQTGQPAALNDRQKQKAIWLIMRTTELRNVSAIQIDFDASSSEREFYRALLQELRAKLPDNIALSMTALASFCVGDRWLDDLPVDEAVPMIFRMGADDRTIKNLIGSGEDFREPLCQRSYGIAVDESLEIKFKPERRVYIFNDHSWTAADVNAVAERIKK
jgi:hypothetical protein